MKDKIIEKLLSGRYLLTVMVGLVYVKLCWQYPKFALETKELIFVVVYAYFNRNDRQNPGGNNV